MKICPSCQSRYTDDTLQFCLQDGTPLAAGEENQTSAPTVAFNSEPETVVKPRETEKMQFDLQNTRESQTWDQPANSANYDQPQKSNTALIVITTILTMLLVFGAAGIGAWLYFSNDDKPLARNANSKASFPTNAERNINSSASLSPEASVTPTEEKTPSPTPKPDINPEQIKKEVSDTVYSWKSLAESRNLPAYMSKYADTIDYYNKKGASISTVRADKQKAFTIYDIIEIDLSNFRVTTDDSGEKATAVFDKEWYFEGNNKSSEGKVQTQLQLRKIGGTWKITGERDLKVYYVD